MSKEDTYLVIGGSGFLGRNIVEYLLNRGAKSVRVFDLRKTWEDSRVQFVLGDITKLDDVEKACKVIFGWSLSRGNHCSDSYRISSCRCD